MIISLDQQKLIDLEHRKYEKILLNFDEDKKRTKTDAHKILKVLFSPSQFFKTKPFDRSHFEGRYQASVMGVYRKNIVVKRLQDTYLENGDILLIKMPESRLAAFEKLKSFVILEEINHQYHPRRAWRAVLIVLSVILLAALNVFPIMVAALLGVLFMFLADCIKAEEIYDFVSWDIIFLLAGLIPLGIAMEKSGTTALITDLITHSSSFLPPMILMMIFYLVTTLITEVISNNASVVLLVPIAISVAMKIGINPSSAALIVMFAASTSFLSPVGYQTNTMVYGAGGYKFTDFARVGGLLNLIFLFLTPFLIYLFFGF